MQPIILIKEKSAVTEGVILFHIVKDTIYELGKVTGGGTVSDNIHPRGT